jgi:quinol monooxygenase YgiN
MYCMIARNQMKPGQVDAVVKGLETDVAPVMKQSPGFRGAYVVAGPTGEYTGIVLWASRADADAYVANPARDTALAGIADKLEGPMKLEFGEVRSTITP